MGYRNRVADAPDPVPVFDDAVRLVARLLDPVLAGPVPGRWNPESGQWH
ncbi:MAG: hypothetical protein H0U35_05240 [Sporichthyaceae bacterium]|nr:hypothetical protein [Sporichthyaceae bacterium]